MLAVAAALISAALPFATISNIQATFQRRGIKRGKKFTTHSSFRRNEWARGLSATTHQQREIPTDLSGAGGCWLELLELLKKKTQLKEGGDGQDGRREKMQVTFSLKRSTHTYTRLERTRRRKPHAEKVLLVA